MPKYIILVCLLLACEPVVSEKIVKPQVHSVSVDDVAYGAFDVLGLENFDSQGLPRSNHYSVVTFTRHFIHERSLYRWAWKYKVIKTMPKTIYLDRIQLIGCQPLEWMIKVSTGGYYEHVDVTCLGLK